MTDGEQSGTPHERMERYRDLTEKAHTIEDERQSELDAVGRELADVVESAAAETGVAAAVTETSKDGSHQTIRARLDRAALVARVTEQLPAGFVVEHVNEDGSLTIEWDDRGSTGDDRRYSAVLKAIVAEDTETDSDGFVTDAPTERGVVERATELGVPEAAATRRLSRLAELDVVDVEDGRVYPDTNFSKF